jgi:hypothetical protein
MFILNIVYAMNIFVQCSINVKITIWNMFSVTGRTPGLEALKSPVAIGGLGDEVLSI